MRTSTLIVGLIAASMFLMSGVCGVACGTTIVTVDESFNEMGIETDTASTGENIAGAGFLAVLAALLLYIGAGIAKVAYKTSTILIGLTLPLAIGIIALDPASLFAVGYYFAIIMTVVAFALMVASHYVVKRQATAYDSQ